LAQGERWHIPLSLGKAGPQAIFMGLVNHRMRSDQPSCDVDCQIV